MPLKDKTPIPCFDCPYEDRVPGSAHSACVFDFQGQGVPVPQGSSHGIKRGWWVFPFNYDPTWMLHPRCTIPATETERDPDKTRKANKALEALMMLMWSRW